jgi:hypothetical protein
MKYIIEPGEGLDVLVFGMEAKEIIDILGTPEEKDTDDDEDFASEIWMYHEKNLTLFVDGEESQVLICLETNHPDTLLFGNKIFEMKEQELIDLMTKNQCGVVDIEEEAWGEKRISYDDLMMDFYFENGKLNTVNWSIIEDEDEDE